MQDVVEKLDVIISFVARSYTYYEHVHYPHLYKEYVRQIYPYFLGKGLGKTSGCLGQSLSGL